MIIKTVGRGSENDIVVDDHKVSRTHLQIVQDDNGNISVVDLESTNGTYVNGLRITKETQLKVGDSLRIGVTELPWQSYFTGEESSSSIQTRTGIPSISPKSKRLWIVIVSGIILLGIVIGCIIIYIHKSNERKISELENEKDRTERLLSAKDKDYSALREKNAKDLEKERRWSQDAVKKAEQEKKALEDKKNQEMKSALNENEQKAKKEKDNMQKEMDALKSEKEVAEGKAKETQREIEQLRSDTEDKQKKLTEAEKKIINYEEAAKLDRKFYQELAKAQREKRLAVVCEKLKLTVRNDADAQFKAIVEKYDNAADNQSRKFIIDTIKDAKTKK